MQSTRQAELVSAGGADLSDREMRLYRRRRRGADLTPYEHQWLNALWPGGEAELEKTARRLDEADREVRRARRNGIAVIDGGLLLAPIVSTGVTRPLARRRGAGRPRAQASRSSARSGDSGDSSEPPADPDRAAQLRGFLADLIEFDWSEALIDGAYAFSVAIEGELGS